MAKNNKTPFLYVLYFDKIGVFDQSEHVQGPINIILNGNTTEWSPIRSVIIRVITKSDSHAYSQIHNKSL